MKNSGLPTISLCMIVRNEEDNIRYCLDSVKDYVDEIIIVDTGSTDSTVDICKEYTEQVYFYQWNDDFSEARNESIKYATKDWILILDADEFVKQEEFGKLEELLQGIDDHIGALNWLCVDMDKRDLGNIDYSELYQKEFVPTVTKVFRNDKGYYFEYSLHNQLWTGDEQIANTDLVFFHYGYIQSEKKRIERYEKNIQKDLKKYPDDIYVKYNHARYFSYIGDSQRMVQLLDNVIAEYKELGQPHRFIKLPEIYETYVTLLFGKEKYYQKVESLAKDWIALNISDEKQLPYYYLGHVYFMQKKYEESFLILKQVERKLEAIHSSKIDLVSLLVETKFLLWAIYCGQNNTEKAKIYYQYLINTTKRKYLLKNETS